MNNPKVSLIVSVFNIEKYLSICLDSISTQTFTDYECIIVDDYSTDNCPLIYNEYAQKDNRILIIKNNKNIGLPLSRKKGLDISKGEFILFIDGDDWIEKDMIEKLYQKAIHNNYDITVCDYYYEKNGIRKLIRQDFSSFDKITIIKKILSIKIKTVVWNKLVKKDLYLLVDFPEYSRGEDYVITLQNIFNAKNIGYVNIPLYHYRYNAQSLSNNKELSIIGRIEENKNWCKVVDLLKERYTDIKIFEPELSKHINNFKEIYFLDDNLKNINELFELYPESNFIKCRILIIIKSILRKILFK